MSEEDGKRPRFKAQLKQNFDVHIPMNIIEGCKISPGDYLTFEIVPTDEGHDSPFTTSHEIEVKQRMAEAEEIGLNTFNYYLPLWIGNFTQWLFFHKEKKIEKVLTVDDILKSEKPRFGIVFGAGPSLRDTTDEQWETLKKSDCCLIATNKALIPMLKHGIVPEWVVVLDGEEVVFNSFNDPILEQYKGQVNFLGPTVADPKVVAFVTDWAKNCYWGNASMPSGHDTDEWNMNVIMELMNNLPMLRHGGNVGTCAWLLAKQLGCDPVGMYGFNLCINPDNTWTRDKAVDFEYLYNPENQEVLAFDSPFRAYISILIGVTDQAWNEEPPVRTVNLTPKGALFMSGFFPNFTLKEYVEKTGVIARADEERAKSLKRIAERIEAAKESVKPIFRADDF